MKKLALIGVLALVVIGCVLAAGCTSQVNTDPDQVNPASGEMFIPDGASSVALDNLSNVVSYLTLDKNGGDTDGHAEITLYEVNCHKFTPATRTGYICTGYYDSQTDGTKIINSDGTVSDTGYYPLVMVYPELAAVWAIPNNGTSEENIHPYYTFYAHWVEDSAATSDNKDDENQIVGSWKLDKEDEYYDFYSDKTGCYTICVNGNWEDTPFTWESNKDGTYTITIGDKKTYVTYYKNKDYIILDSGRIFEWYDNVR